MSRYQALALTSKYWKPATNYIAEIVQTLDGKVRDGDFVVISEKAVSTAKSNVIDESQVKPTLTARLLAQIWMPLIWGYILGAICHFGQRLLFRLRHYPAEGGSQHKQVALQYAGFGQALMFGSEGGIDGSNLPYSLVSMPLQDAFGEANLIQQAIKQILGKQVTVVIVDSDKTYSLRSFHLTPRPKPMKGIVSRAGLATYIFCKALRLRRRPTPLAVAGRNLAVEEALTIANIADRARGPGSGATVWDMAARFKVDTTQVTWNMLERVKHKPLVIVRKMPWKKPI